MELTYIRQILKGEISKFSYFVETYKNMAYSIAFRILNNREDAEEAVQDSFLKAYTALSIFRAESKFSTWLYKIVVNISINKLRRKQQFNNNIITDDVADTLVENIEASYKNLHHEEQIRLINLALEKLEMEDRLLLTLYYLNENSIAEVAEITSITAENVKVKIHRARAKMFSVLSKILKTEI